MKTFTLRSDDMYDAPAIVPQLVQAFKDNGSSDGLFFLKTYWGLPHDAAVALLSGRATFRIEDRDAVVFDA